MARLSGETKLLLAGLLIFGIVLFTLETSTRNAQRRVEAALTACKAEDASLKEERKITFELLCDPAELARESGNTGVQLQLGNAEIERAKWESRAEWLWPGALLVAVLCGLPWAWSFILKRIRELSNAIAGRP